MNSDLGASPSVNVYTSVFTQAGRDRANRHLHALCSMVLGADHSDPATNHGLNASAGVLGRPEHPQRLAQKPQGSSWRCPMTLREEPACTRARSGAGSWGISRSSPRASGLVAMCVRDAPRTPADGFSPWLVAGSLWSAPNTILQRACRCRLARSRPA